MNLTFAALEAGIQEQITDATILQPNQSKEIAEELLKYRSRFLILQHTCGVPALWVMPVFHRENPSFESYLGNGDPLDKVTTHVPRGRGPFASWELGAADSLKLDHITGISPWSWTRACYEWESWNGFGPREYHARPSGYVWSWTNQYVGGKYIADGKWSRGTWDQQPGCFAIAKAIAELDEEIGKGLS